MSRFEQARQLLYKFKADTYLYGTGVLNEVGSVAAAMGKKAVLVCDHFPGSDRFIKTITDSLANASVTVTVQLDGAKPNC